MRLSGVLALMAALVSCGRTPLDSGTTIRAPAAGVTRSSGDGGGVHRTLAFAPPIVAFPEISFWHFELGDIDRDGNLDMVTTDAGNPAILVLSGRGDGRFDAPVRYPTRFHGDGFTLADFDRDGRLDIALASGNAPQVEILFWGDAGPREPMDAQPGGGLVLASGDLDGDGWADLVGTDLHAQIDVLRGVGGGRMARDAVLAAPREAMAVVLSDFDGDGALDLGVASFDQGVAPFTVFLSRKGGFSLPISYTGGVQSHALAIGDFDEDGAPDVATANSDFRPLAEFVTLYRNRGNGTFHRGVPLPAGDDALGIAASDLDGDGHIDIVVTAPYRQELTVLRGDGTGGFQPPLTFGAGIAAATVLVADLDHDGQPDLVTGSSTSPGGLSVLLNRSH